MTTPAQLMHAHPRADHAFRATGCETVRTLDAAIRHVECVRGIRIRTTQLEALDRTSLCGLLVVGSTSVTIFHAPASSPLHRLQCILHELGHLLLHHDETSLGNPRLQGFVPDIALEAGDRVFGRSDLRNQDEIDAERLADLLAARIRDHGEAAPGLEEFFG